MRIHLLLVLGLMTLLPGNLAAADSRNDDAADRLSKSADVLREVAAAGDKGIPEQVLTRAKCIVVVPNLVKAGLLVGGKYGRALLCAERTKATKLAQPSVPIRRQGRLERARFYHARGSKHRLANWRRRHGPGDVGDEQRGVETTPGEQT